MHTVYASGAYGLFIFDPEPDSNSIRFGGLLCIAEWALGASAPFILHNTVEIAAFAFARRFKNIF